MNMALRVLAWHVHVNGSYRFTVDNRKDAMTFLDLFKQKLGSPDKWSVTQGEMHITCINEESGVHVQIMNLPPQLGDLLPKSFVRPSACAVCSKMVFPLVNELCAKDDCSERLCDACRPVVFCPKHTEVKE